MKSKSTVWFKLIIPRSPKCWSFFKTKKLFYCPRKSCIHSSTKNPVSIISSLSILFLFERKYKIIVECFCIQSNFRIRYKIKTAHKLYRWACIFLFPRILISIFLLKTFNFPYLLLYYAYYASELIHLFNFFFDLISFSFLWYTCKNCIFLVLFFISMITNTTKLATKTTNKYKLINSWIILFSTYIFHFWLHCGQH